MRPKVIAALRALENGCQRVVITDTDGFARGPETCRGTIIES